MVHFLGKVVEIYVCPNNLERCMSCPEKGKICFLKNNPCNHNRCHMHWYVTGISPSWTGTDINLIKLNTEQCIINLSNNWNSFKYNLHFYKTAANIFDVYSWYLMFTVG